MNERKFDMNRDGLGLLLFALGLFPAVLIVKALLATAPIESISGDGPIALSWIKSLGGIPSLLFTAGIMFVGGRLFLFGKRDGLLRDALGIAGVALCMSILFGAFSPTAGGRLGNATGGLVSSVTHVVVGAAFGIVAVALAVWFTWLREERAPRIAIDSESGIDTILDEETDTGVSAEEAAALIPEDFNRAMDEGRKQLALKPLRSAPPPSPYPEDVRLKGQIPPGARPLNPEQDVRNEPDRALQPSAVYRWTAPRADLAGDGPDEDLATLPEPETVFAAEPVADEETWGGVAAVEESAAADPIERKLEEIEPELELSSSAAIDREIEITDAEDTTAANESAEPAELLGALPRPSWEQSSLFTEAPETDEPVDAYGTPLTLVEALRQERGANASDDLEVAGRDSGEPTYVLPAETDFAPELEAGGEDELEFEDAGARSMRAAGVPSLEDARAPDLDDADDVDEEFEAVEEEPVEVEAESDADDEEYEEDEAGEDDGQLLVADDESEAEDDLEDMPPAPAAAGPSVDGPLFESPPVKLPLVELPLVELPLVELMEERDRAAHDGSALGAAAPRKSEVQASKPDRGARVSKTGGPARGEQDLILQPRAAPPEKTIKSPPAFPDRAELLRDAGCLFVDRGRVAVSMLQRQYGMDFDQACEVLDELQSLGLIGPYLGGQRRDILLTREQWLEKVGSV